MTQGPEVIVSVCTVMCESHALRVKDRVKVKMRGCPRYRYVKVAQVKNERNTAPCSYVYSPMVTCPSIRRLKLTHKETKTWRRSVGFGGIKTKAIEALILGFCTKIIDTNLR